MLSITDTGIGMPTEVLNRAFEPFFTTKELGHGSGLGLSQVYGFVKQSGGHIRIYSELGQGTTVKIYLPRFIGVGNDEQNLEDELAAQGEEGETVLIVEDDEDVRAYLTEAVRSLGYRVTTAANATVALDILSNKDRRFDLMLTDVVMPGMNGRQLGAAAAKLRPNLRIIYMTGYPRNAVTHQGRLEEGLEVLQKPITQSLLASRLRDSLDKLH
jgi:CheY-like chemotaxis protein